MVNIDYINQYTFPAQLMGTAMSDTTYLTAEEASAELNVSKATLYAYVSRGLIRSEQADDSRRHLYRGDDVRTMRNAKENRREEGASPGGQILWGAPVLDSAITYIGDEGLFYRGRDAVALARNSSVEHVARLLWDVEGGDPFLKPPPPEVIEVFSAASREVHHLPAIDRCISLLPRLKDADISAFATDPEAMAQVGATLMRVVSASVAELPLTDRPITDVLAQGWAVKSPAAVDLIRMSLILSADHELNVSAFTVRCTMSAGATPYGAIAAGLVALQGYRHGGAVDRTIAFLEEARRADDIANFIRARLRRGSRIPGFGHPIYQGTDPRAEALLGAIWRGGLDLPYFEASKELVDTIIAMTGLHPNVDFANALLALGLSLPEQGGVALFAVGRSMGWMAHAIEQVESRALIRPRARYVGARPSPDRQGGAASI